MDNVNMSSILKIAKKYMKTKDGRALAYNACSDVVKGKSKAKTSESSGGGATIDPKEAGDKFIEILKLAISSAGLSNNVEKAVSEDWEITDITTIEEEGKPPRCEVSVDFTGDKFRFSLDVPKYVGIDNIVALYNNGVDHTMKQVWGTWIRKDRASGAWEEIEGVGSRTNIPATNFIQDAVEQFMAAYGDEYYVEKIDIHSDYTG